MIGIYKITEIATNRIYIGKSNDIERRFKEHQTKGKNSRIPLDKEILEKGIDAFKYEVLELCTIEQLNEKENYWIQTLNTKEHGFNKQDGGLTDVVGSHNPKAKLTEQDIIKIRTAYASHISQKEVYKAFQNIISFNYFQNLWEGRAWKHVMPEVFTEENKQYYIFQNSLGKASACAFLTDKEVLKIRKRYVVESAKEIYKDFSNRISYQTLQSILWGRHYKHLPIYKKKEKRWIDVEPVSTIPYALWAGK